jgi:hypothetical protein
MTCANWNGWIYEHIYIAETTLKRRLRDDEIVHHLDMSRANNHPSNLCVMTRSGHRLLHAWLKKGAPGYEASAPNNTNSKKCESTQKEQPSPYCKTCGSVITGKGLEYCSLRCIPRKSKTDITKEKLQALVWKKPLLAIAQELGVSDKAVKKWCLKWNLQVPPRGFWISSTGRAILNGTVERLYSETPTTSDSVKSQKR